MAQSSQEGNDIITVISFPPGKKPLEKKIKKQSSQEGNDIITLIPPFHRRKPLEEKIENDLKETPKGLLEDDLTDDNVASSRLITSLFSVRDKAPETKEITINKSEIKLEELNKIIKLKEAELRYFNNNFIHQENISLAETEIKILRKSALTLLSNENLSPALQSFCQEVLKIDGIQAQPEITLSCLKSLVAQLDVIYDDWRNNPHQDVENSDGLMFVDGKPCNYNKSVFRHLVAYSANCMQRLIEFKDRTRVLQAERETLKKLKREKQLAAYAKLDIGGLNAEIYNTKRKIAFGKTKSLDYNIHRSVSNIEDLRCSAGLFLNANNKDEIPEEIYDLCTEIANIKTSTKEEDALQMLQDVEKIQAKLAAVKKERSIEVMNRDRTSIPGPNSRGLIPPKVKECDKNIVVSYWIGNGDFSKKLEEKISESRNLLQDYKRYKEYEKELQKEINLLESIVARKTIVERLDSLYPKQMASSNVLSYKSNVIEK